MSIQVDFEAVAPVLVPQTAGQQDHEAGTVYKLTTCVPLATKSGPTLGPTRLLSRGLLGLFPHDYGCRSVKLTSHVYLMQK